MILFCWFPQIETESVDVDSEINETPKKAQETPPEGDDTFDTGTPRLPMPKLGVQETLLSLLRQLL